MLEFDYGFWDRAPLKCFGLLVGQSNRGRGEEQWQIYVDDIIFDLTDAIIRKEFSKIIPAKKRV
ncbi:hypothetical protein MTR_4g044165 [Medicago truncatula]|uniref:Uncharacterized protein n=1 Tax=Medicago truncatula TaxID=3880 RepID=A0A072UIE3_MEDTR|nr:hypothetical protein MTR_4g044165 [Medicago truncatula]